VNTTPRDSANASEVTHEPNRLALSERAFNLMLASVLMAYGAAGLLTHKLKVSNRGSVLVQLEGGPAWLMAAALILGACVFLSWVIDHYDTRNNENYYRAFRRVVSGLGWCLVVSALVAHLYLGFTR
jgi:hypothetical protein